MLGYGPDISVADRVAIGSASLFSVRSSLSLLVGSIRHTRRGRCLLVESFLRFKSFISVSRRLVFAGGSRVSLRSLVVVFTSLAFAEPWFSLRSISRWTHGPGFAGQCGESVDFTPLARFCGGAAEFHRSIFGETAESLRSNLRFGELASVLLWPIFFKFKVAVALMSIFGSKRRLRGIQSELDSE